MDVTQSTAPEVSVSAAPATIVEGAAITLTFTADEAPSAALTVKYEISGGQPLGLAPRTTFSATIASGETMGTVVHDTDPDDRATGSDSTVSFRIEDSLSPAGADYLIDTGSAAVTVQQDTKAPSLSTTTPPSVNGATLVLTYDEALDETSTPAASAFAVTVAGATRAVSSVSIAGSTVTLTLASAVGAGDTVTLDYTAPSSNPIQDEADNDAGNLNNQAVTDATPDAAAPMLSTATVNGAALTLTYGEALDTAHTPGNDDFTVEADDSGFDVTGVSVSGTTVILTLASAVAHGQTVELDYTLPAAVANRLQDAAGNEAAALTDRSVTNNTPDTTAPALSTATVDGTTLVLTYGEALETAHDPGTGAFTVEAGTTAITVSSVAIASTTVTLTLASGVTAGQMVTLDYTLPAAVANRLQDAAGNEAATLTNRSVANNTAGAVLSISTLTVTEGGTATYTIVANTQPGGSVAWVDLASDNTGKVTVTGPRGASNVNLLEGGWQVPKTITVTAVQDADSNDETATITHTVIAGNAPPYNTVAIPSVSVGVTDDEMPSIAYAGSFAEAAANDGSVTGNVTATLTGDTFAAGTGAGGTTAAGVSASNVPAGLTAVLTRTSDTVVTLTLTGNANANDVSNVTITFTDAAFENETAATVSGTTKSDIAVDFANPSSIGYAGSFTEAATNNGAVTGTVTATLTGDTFARQQIQGPPPLPERPVVEPAVGVSATNVPAGLTAAFTRTSDTVVTLILTGTATNHANTNDVNDLTITFTDEAFDKEAASRAAH